MFTWPIQHFDGKSFFLLFAHFYKIQLADASEKFADEISSALYQLERGGRSVPSAYIKKVKELRKRAKKLFSQNVLLVGKTGKKLSHSTWIDKSMWRVSDVKTEAKEPYSHLAFPHAVHFDLPYQWSL